MDELRWFLLVVGLVVIAAVYLYGRIEEWRQDGPPWSRKRRESRDPFADDTLDPDELRGALDELDTLITESQTEIRAADREPAGGGDEPTAEPETAAEPVARETRPAPEPEAPRPADAHSDADLPKAARSEPTAEVPEPAPAPAPSAGTADGTARRGRRQLDAVSSRLRHAFASAHAAATRETAPAGEEKPADGPHPAGEPKVVVLNVMAPQGTVFTGPGVVEALQAAGLRHGEHGIFHRRLETRSGVIALYSVANILKPGWFDLDRIEEFETPGLAFFLQLPGPFDGLAAFEQMLQSARGVAAQLGGHVLDSRRCDLTHQAIEHIREDLLEYRRRAHIAARQAR